MNTQNKAALEKIKTNNQNFTSKQSIMTMYERETIKEEMDRVISQYKPVIAQDAITDWKNTIKKAQDALKTEETAKAAEVNRWDAGKFNSELKTTQALIEMAKNNKNSPLTGGPKTGQRVNDIYKDAQRSGDPFKARAAAEVMQTLDANSFSEDARLDVMNVKRQAAKDLESIRVTPELTQAAEARKSAFSELLAGRQELIDTAKTLGEDPEIIWAFGPFTKALKLVQVKNGGIQFYSEDAPEVTGYSTVNEFKNKDMSEGWIPE